jgi:hypothetical protein
MLIKTQHKVVKYQMKGLAIITKAKPTMGAVSDNV